MSNLPPPLVHIPDLTYISHVQYCYYQLLSNFQTGAMVTWSLDRISIVQPNMEMKNKEAMLSNALIATPIPPTRASRQ
uniref:Uncharacterized protein n=1 Tax=Arundo donax TaxID=35708 RepID=A0A0A9F5V8_ARUDO